MASEEKKLYKEITVQSNQKPKVRPSQRAYRGLSTVNPDNTNFKLFDIALIKQDIINLFHIRKGEKLEDPNFGTIIWDMVYEPLTNDNRDFISENVTEIINYDPRVQVDGVTVSQYESGIQIECQLTYLTYNVSENMRLRFDEDAGLLN
tara:strand:+ start:421 stop:867 length:447 start_codon:yes stop_codon:yes gene_type:complete